MLNKLLRCGWVLCSFLLLLGCMKGPTTPEERERAKEVLEETSPRNLDEHPKAVPILKYKLPE